MSSSASAAASLAALSSLMMTPTTTTTTPRRGGNNTTFGTFVGGSVLNNEYKLTKTNNFKSSSQLRTSKTLSTLENTLNATLLDSSSLKFNGRLDTTSTTTEINKEQFIVAVRRMVKKFGFQSLFSIPSQDGLKMMTLEDDPHSFSLDQVLNEFNSRNIEEPPLVVNTNGIESAESIIQRFKCYDDYEAYDLNLSRLVIETLVHPVLRETIATRYDHLDDFLDLPGQVYFKLALEACHASTALDIATASKTLNALKLSTFPGENINDISTSILRQVKIIQSGWAIPFDTGSSILHKVTHTECEYFNRTMYSLLDKVSEMEDSCGEAGNPKELTSHIDYSKLGPIGICNSMQNTYGTLIKKGKWPATSSIRPEGNWSSTDSARTSTKSTKRRNPDGKRCRLCGSVFHFLRDCPDADNTDNIDDTTTTNDSTSTVRTSNTSDTTGSTNVHPSAAWRYEVPSDINATITRNDRTYKFCSKCVCSKTGRRGFFNRTHCTRDHRGGVSGTSANNSTTPPATTPPATDSTTSTTTQAPSGNHSPHTHPSDDQLVDSDPNGLQFEGAFMAPVDCDDGAWMASQNEPSNNDENNDILDAVGVTLQNISISDEDSDEISSPQILFCDGCGNEGMAYTCCDCEGIFSSETNDYAPWSDSDRSDDDDTNEDNLIQMLFCNDCGLEGQAYTKCDCEGIFCLNTPATAPVPSPKIILVQTTLDFKPKSESTNDKTKSDQDSYFDCFDYIVAPPIVDEFFDCTLLPDHTPLVPSSSPASSLLKYTYLALSSLKIITTAICSTYIQLGDQIRSYILKCFLLLTTIVWDTLDLFHLLRSTFRIKRKPRNLSSFQSFPRRWLILSCYMLFANHNTLHPVAAFSSRIMSAPFTIHNKLQSTASRVLQLSALIDLDSITIVKYNYQRLTSWQHNYNPTTPIPQLSSAVPSTSNLIEPHFFPSFSSLAEMEGESNKLDFFSCQDNYTLDASNTDLDSPFNWLDLSTITEDVHHVHLHYPADVADPSTIGLDAICSHPSAYTAAAQMGKIDLFLPSFTSSNLFQVIFDSGASLAISPSKSDFIGEISPLPTPRFLGGMANGLRIDGIGNIRWGFKMDNKLLIIHSRCYYVPDAKARLISPQRLFNAEKGVNGHFLVKESHAILHYEGVGSLKIDYDSKNRLPIALGKPITGDLTSPHLNLAVLNEANQNLTPAQKLLLLWHARFGHKGFQHLQTLLRAPPFSSVAYKAASRCQPPRCEVCEYSKAHRQPTHGATQSKNPLTEGALKSNNLRAGNRVSVDHFESRLKGRTIQSRGRATSDQYVGGCVFVDHMSGYIHVEPQLGFSSSETIRAKQNFEKFSLDHGVLVDSYLADNGVFKANAFVQHIHTHNQKLKYCGVNAHHQNAVAERSIRTVSECARALLLHASLHWKEGIDSSLWPMAVEYATYIYNNTPNQNGIAPADLFTGVQIPRHKLKDIHVWGAPVYVLDPTLQQGRKLPKWEPRARRGIFVGFSRVHASDVPLILNTLTGHISPQYHVVFDDTFSTVESLHANADPPPFWDQIGLDETVYSAHVHRIPLDSDSTLRLSSEWLTPQELEERTRRDVRAVNVRGTYAPTQPITAPLPIPSTSNLPPTNDLTASTPDFTPEPIAPTPAPTAILPPQVPASTLPTSPRRSTRARTSPNLYIPTFLSSINPSQHSSHSAALAYTAELDTDINTGDMNCTDPRAYAAKTKLHDPDQPSYHEAMSGAHAPDYITAMKKEIRALIQQNTWIAVPRKTVPRASPILAGTWAFKLKRLPDGAPLKYKARYCVRGDLQREGIDFFDTYAPVVQWSTIRMLLTLTLNKGWTTKQVDYTNAFAQAALKETVYIEPPKGFGRRDGLDRVLKLITSLYGLRQAPKTFFEKLRDGLVERGFKQSAMDPCLFLKDQMICVVYVDDTIIAGPDGAKIEELITSLGVRKDEQRHTFVLRDEGEVGDFLGIRIEKKGNRRFKLSQPGLINKVIKTSNMEDCNPTRTPALTTPLGSDQEGEDFKENWSYPTIVGMLMFLANNSRPDIAFAVHQCARFTHCPKESHAAGVKRIIRYLKGTREEGMYLEPSPLLTVDCYVDADFAGLWKSEDSQDPICVKSRSGHVIMFMGCPLQWQSKLQTQIALSTMESEYIALSLAMRELIAVRVVLKEIFTHVFHSPSTKITYATIASTFKMPASTVYEDNEACLKFASMPKMSPRTKHIAIPYHFFRSKVQELEIKVVGIDTKSQLADQFTKGLPQDKFEHDRKILLGW